MPTGDLALVAALLPVPEMEAMAELEALLGSLDVIVLRLVAKALRGDVRAIAWIFDVIEGRPERRGGDVRFSRSVQGKRSTGANFDPVERARMIAELEATLKKDSNA